MVLMRSHKKSYHENVWYGPKTRMVDIRYLFLLTMIFAGYSIFHTNSINDIFVPSTGKTNLNDRGIINTMGCTIPDLDPLDDSIINFVEYPDLPKCRNASLSLLGKNKTTIWIKFEKYIFDYYNITEDDKVSCCYQSFYKPVSVEDVTSWYVDDRVEYDNCITFSNTIEVKHEFVRVNCSVDKGTRPIYVQFFLFARQKNFAMQEYRRKIVNNTGYNVLVIGIDSVSRLNFLRTIQKTAMYLNKKGAIQMLGYNKVGRNTFPNLVPMLMGVKVTELSTVCYPNRKASLDNCPFVWEWYKQAGYYTAFVEDGAIYATFNYLKAGFIGYPTDYYTRTWFQEAEKHFNGSELCLNDIYYYQVILNYIEDITYHLKSRRLFGFFWENSMTHNELNFAMKMDEDYVKMLTSLEKTGYLNDTVVVFVSDHGMRWGPIRETKQGRIEENLPFLYLLFPPSFQYEHKKAYNNLKQNSKRLTTPFDVHETLSDLIDLAKVSDSAISIRIAQSYALKRGISLFLSIPSNRTCRAADIDDQWCNCHKEINLGKDNPKTIEAAASLVRMINSLMVNYPQCALLNLSEIVEGIEILSKEMEKSAGSWMNYMVKVRTDPGKMTFQGLLRQNSEGQTWQLNGFPNRLERYEESWCVSDSLLKNYCYCISTDAEAEVQTL